MTELRDARLKQALDAAPDADARPVPAVADAIRAAARQALPKQAVATPVPEGFAPWWQRLWQSTASPRAPWNAAFATVLVAVLVTVLWVREPIPDARPLATAPETSPVLAPVPEPIAQDRALETPAVAEKAKAPAKASAVKTEAARTATADVEIAPVETAAQAPAPEPAAVAVAEPAPAAAPAAAATPPAVAMPRAAPMSAPVASKGVAATAALESADQTSASVTGLQAWTHLAVQRDARSATLDRAQGRLLMARLQALTLRLEQEPASAGTAPVTQPRLQLTVLSQGKTLAVLRLWEGVALWQRPGEADRVTGVAAADMQAWLLLAEQAMSEKALREKAPPEGAAPSR